MCTICMMTQTFDPHRHAPGEPAFANVNEGSDAAENTTTSYSMDVGDTFYGTISNSTDEDWVRIELVAGTTYEFELDGLSLSDTFVTLYDQSGSFLDDDDDGGPGFDSLLEYTATRTGTYYIEADAFYIGTGSYALSVTEVGAGPPPPTPGEDATIEELGTFLLEGTDGNRISFNTNQSNQITVDITGLDADGRQLARWAMEAWEMVADIDFVVQTDGQGNEMITVDDEDGGAFAYFPNSGSTSRVFGDNTTGVELNVSDEWLDVEGTTLDSYSFQTYVHEFGHALGLNHQGDYNFTGQPISYENDASFANDSWQLSVMSYFSQTENTTTNASYAFTAGAMMADIWAIQEFYGAPDENSATAGDTTYGNGSNLGNYMDLLFDVLATGNTTNDVVGNQVAFTIYDRDGFDTLNLGFTQQNARLDLRDGQFSDFGNNIGILGIAQGTVIEEAVLGAGNDTVTGNTADNTLVTNGGRDSVTADAGDDRIFAGSGSDTVSGGAGADTVWGGDGQDLIYLNRGDDLFNDNTQGGAFGADTVYAGLGNDTIEGGEGGDVFFGEDGSDVINARIGADEVFGGAGADTLSGGNGNDTVSGGNGRDLVFLGNGNDMFLDNDQGGTFGRDTVFAGAGDDLISGGSGADRIYGGAGDDVIDGGAGQDVLTGGSGRDTFVFETVGFSETITDFEIGVDLLSLLSELVGGRSAAQVADQMFEIGDGHIALEIGSGQTIYLEGLSSFDDIASSINII